MDKTRTKSKCSVLNGDCMKSVLRLEHSLQKSDTLNKRPGLQVRCFCKETSTYEPEIVRAAKNACIRTGSALLYMS